MRQSDPLESTAGALYRELSADKYRHWPYETVSLDDEMGLVNEAICGYWKPRFLMDYRTETACEFMGAAVRGRLDRLGADAIWHQSASSAGNDTVRTAVLRTMRDMPDAGMDDLEMCPAERFSAWLAEGAAVYREMQVLAKSVLVEVHLDRRRHTLPYVEGKYAILLDGRKVGVGNFIKGYTLRFRTSPGRHVLSAYAFGGILTVPFEFETARGGSYRIEMDYKYVFRATSYRVFVESITRVA